MNRILSLLLLFGACLTFVASSAIGPVVSAAGDRAQSATTPTTSTLSSQESAAPPTSAASGTIARAVNRAREGSTHASSNTTGFAAEESTSVTEDAADSCLNSFTAETPVLMADGTEEPISDVKVGDRVLATDPQAEVSELQPVAALIRHTGLHTMVDITLSDGSNITATDHHPFWDASTQAFTYAINLHPGDAVLGEGGRTLSVRTVHDYNEYLTAYNLQISGIHTYYAGTTPVLVHNSCGDPFLTPEGEAHVAARHLPGGSMVDESSGLFHEGTDLHQLVEDAASSPANQDADGNWVRIVNARKPIGTTSMLTGGVPTSFYRLIQTTAGYTITLHPW